MELRPHLAHADAGHDVPERGIQKHDQRHRPAAVMEAAQSKLQCAHEPATRTSRKHGHRQPASGSAPPQQKYYCASCGQGGNLQAVHVTVWQAGGDVFEARCGHRSAPHMLNMLDSRVVMVSKRCSELLAPGQHPKLAMILRGSSVRGQASCAVLSSDTCMERGPTR